MRIVLDTNVLVRAFASPHGPAGEVLESIRFPHLLVISEQILLELADVLGRESVRKLHGQDEHTIDGFLQRIESAALVVAIDDQTVPAVVPNDRDDDLVVATAIQGKAAVICTLDRHFHAEAVIDYCRQHLIKVMDDLQLLNVLRGKQGKDADGAATES